ncbi:TOMM precursor leader peptide-binding protein [Saccharopolyspora shandongensis]|uniref:TOMM precursor leader peptide-binding protein n=1 Tax=Saccharopolyspora shandongensis TaxID=418495 RepID=UPI00341757AE
MPLTVEPTAPTRTGQVAVLGSGSLHDAVSAALAELSTASEADVVVTASDCWTPPERPAIRADAAWLPVHVELGNVVIGPSARPGTPGCPECVRRHRKRVIADSPQRAAVHRQYESALTSTPSALLNPLAADAVAAIVAEDVARVAGDRPARTRDAMLLVDLERLTVSTHRFLPDPLCPACGDLPADTPERAEIRLAPRPKPEPGTYRIRSLLGDVERLVDTYVDDQTGLIRDLHRDNRGGVVVAAARLPVDNGADNESEFGWGRSHNYSASQLIAIMEAIERHGGFTPGGRKTSVTASFAEVRDDALDPRLLGMHLPEQYREPDFPYPEFTEDRPYNWRWGYSFARGKPLLVPEGTGYYGVWPGSGRQHIVYECSNGCAVGNCLEEAILYGILEVAERDAFLMGWYARLPFPRIDLSTARDPSVPMLAAAITAATGYQVHVFDMTMEHGIPSVWAQAVHPDDASDGRAMTMCSANTHLSTERAVRNALNELGPMVVDLEDRYPADEDGAKAMVTDPDAVTKLSDHRSLYCTREAFDRFDFLMTGDEVRSLPELSTWDLPCHADLTDDLRSVLDRYLSAGHDVIVVDQTTSEHAAGGFSCVRVLIPGLIPMTFGHRFRRTHGLPRLRTIPARLGFLDRELRPDELNPHPHPFT